MDYDDNDFESQNLHLAGEGSTKFPPVLRPYALPKFDFDESLQANLRFDSLVETEVFLGIESNEDNQWIDAFSRGVNGIEFSSAATGSCSISRHGNVWSEATSSESVEMLLKSVGQGEYIPRQTFIQESNVCDELACLAKQMEPNPKPDDKNEIKDNITDLHPPGGSGSTHTNLYQLKEDVEMEHMRARLSQGHEGELSFDGSSCIPEPNSIRQNIDLPISEGTPTLFPNDKSNNTNQREVETLADDLHDGKTHDNSSAFAVETNMDLPMTDGNPTLFTNDESSNTNQRELETVADDLHDGNVENNSTESTMQNMVDEQHGPQQTQTSDRDLEPSMMNKEHEQHGPQQTQTNNNDLEPSMMNEEAVVDTQTLDGKTVGGDAHHPNKSLFSIPTQETLEGGSVVKVSKTVLTSLEDSLRVGSVAVSDLQKDQRCGKDVCSRVLSQANATENLVLLKDEVMDGQSAPNTCALPRVSNIDDSVSEEQVIEVNNSSCGVCPNLQKNVDVMEKKTHNGSHVTKKNELLTTDDHIGLDILCSKSEASMFPAEEDGISVIGEGNSNNSVRTFSSFSSVASSTNPILRESTQMCANSEPKRQSFHERFEHHVSVNDQEIEKIYSGCSQMHSDVVQFHLGDKGVVSSSHRAGSTESELKTSTVSINDESVNNPVSASQVITENVSLISCEIMDNPSPGEVVPTQKASGDNDFQRVAAVESSSAEVKEESAVKIAEGAGISTLNGSSEQETTPCPVKETEKLHPSDTFGQLSCNTASDSMHDVVTCGAVKISEPGRTTDDEVTQECTEEIGMPPVLHESSEKEGDGVTVSVINDNTASDSMHYVVTCGAVKISEPGRRTDDEVTQECTEEIGMPPVLHESSEKEGDGVTVSVINDNTASDSMHDVVTCGAVKISEPGRTTDDEITQECTEEIGMPPVLHESSEKEGDGDTVSVIKDDKETLWKIRDNSSPKELGEVLLGNKGSISSARLPESCVELPATGSFPDSSTCSPSNTFKSSSQTEKVESQTEASAGQNPPASCWNNSGQHNTLSTAIVIKGDNASKDERSSTPKVNSVVGLSKDDSADVNIEDVGKSQSVPITAINNASMVMEGSPSTSGLGPSKTKTVGNISFGSPQISHQEVVCSASKTTPERKTRRSSNKAAGKESGRRGSRMKDTTPAKQSGRGDKSTKVSLSPPPGFKSMQMKEVKQYRHTDSNSTKSLALVNTSASSLPDLNTSVSSPVLFHQPFMDLQQVQLRAQIFVYGALIQGTAPDEAYMISAFGGTDSGRCIWENAWRTCMDRQHSQKSHPINPETPLQSQSVARTPDSAVKQSAHHGKGIPSPLGRASSMATPTISNPLIPLSSPLWNLPTLSCDSLQSSVPARGSVVDFSQALTPLHPYQSPPPRNFLGHNTSWMSQAPLRGPWIGSPIPALDNSTHLSASPSSDTIKLGSTKGSSLPPSGLKNVTPAPPPSNASFQSIFAGTAQLDANNVTILPAQHSSDPKPRKRKKVVASEDLGQKALQSRNPAVGGSTTTSVSAVTPVGNVPMSTVEKSAVSVSSLADQPRMEESADKRILSDESLMKVKEARVYAEEASALSAAAVNHSLELWNQLDKHKNYGLMSDIEAKLASAAVAVAAAAAVAKAAAAAANVASNAAFQAKLMADEALVSSGYENSSLSNKNSLSEGTSNLGQATPASILKGAYGTNGPGSIMVAAKEAVRRRVEAASAATKRAENMDAIVKAAELAAEAVSQAGRIVTMGDPLPLINLVEAGPEGSLKAARESSQEGMTRDLVNVDSVMDISEASHMHNKDISFGGISSSVKIPEHNSGQKACIIADLAMPGDMVPESEPEIQAPPFTVSNGSENLEEIHFKEGSIVEVFKEVEGYKAAWFVANILTLKECKAYVCFTSLVSVEGPLKEWVSLECGGDKPPRIRTARPLINLQHEGGRKRRRTTLGDYAWSVGDRVDAWIHESWQEGVITEKNKKDETTLTVHFPGSGETSLVRAWQLRPSLIWKDGEWIEFSKVEANDSSTHEGDTPHGKRPKLGSNAYEVKGKAKMPKSLDAAESANPDEVKLLNLSENEKVFKIGKNRKNENKKDSQRLGRSGLQKEGPKVNFAVPKPGKKRKFMEVSKHYDAHGSNKTDDRNDSVKLVNFLMPQDSGSSRGWRNSSKNNTREKLVADPKPKTKSGKPQDVLGRDPPKNVAVSGAFSLTTDPTGHTEELTKDSSNRFKNASQGGSRVERAPHSTADGSTVVPILFSSLATSTDALPTKRTHTSRASKGKLEPACDKLGKGELERALNDKPVTKSTSAPDVAEPRRSNRRIQPTSRLLEGLQSSLIISKIPSISHNRHTPKGNSQG